MKPYYEHAGITIYHGDCREVLPHLTNVDLVLTDPPYGIAHKSSHGASWENTQIQNDEDTLIRDWLVQKRPADCMAVFGTWKVAPPDGVKGCLVWDKGSSFGMGDLSFPWKGSWELCWIFGNGWKGKRDEGVLRGHFCPPSEKMGRRHPHQKPESLIATIALKGPSGKILDPFAGSGTTLVASKQLNRKAIGIEIEERYCEIAAKRLEQEVMDFG